jgi:PAS domain S-box-containing protein
VDDGLVALGTAGAALLAFAVFGRLARGAAAERTAAARAARAQAAAHRAALLRVGEAHARRLAEAQPHPVWVGAPDGTTRYVNRHWVEYTGLDPTAGDPAGWFEAVHPEDRDALRATHAARLAEGAAYDAEVRLRRADGAYRWHRTTVTPLREDAERAEHGDAARAAGRSPGGAERPWTSTITARPWPSCAGARTGCGASPTPGSWGSSSGHHGRDHRGQRRLPGDARLHAGRLGGRSRRLAAPHAARVRGVDAERWRSCSPPGRTDRTRRLPRARRPCRSGADRQRHLRAHDVR